MEADNTLDVFPFQTDYEVALEFFYHLKWGSNMVYRLPAPLGCVIVP